MDEKQKMPKKVETASGMGNKPLSNRTGRIYLCVAVLFVLVLTVMGTLIFALPHKTYSENENRELKQFPAPKWSTILCGEWQGKLADFLTDQFPGRDYLTAASSAVLRGAGIRDISGAFVGKDGYYFEMTTEQAFDRERFRMNLLSIERFAKAYPEIDMTVLLAPDAGVILPEKLPTFAEMYDADKSYRTAEELLPDATVIDLRDALIGAKNEGQLYYRTDHHWTTLGAYYAYRAYMISRGETPDSYESFSPETVTEEFLGTLYSKVLDASTTPDPIEIIRLPDTLSVTENGGEASVYHMDALEKKDKYTVFFGGNPGKVVIRNSAVKNGKTLLVFKDSFANSMVPFLTGEYEKIVMIDLRYFRPTGKEDPVTALMRDEGVTEVLFLYQLSGFSTFDKLISALKESR